MNSAQHKFVGSAMHDRLIGAIETCCQQGETQRYLNITDEELRKSMTGVWERRRQLRAVSQ